MYSKVNQLHIYLLCFRLFSHISHYRVLRFPVLYSKSSLVIYFIYSNVYVSIPVSQFILPLLLPFSNFGSIFRSILRMSSFKYNLHFTSHLSSSFNSKWSIRHWLGKEHGKKCPIRVSTPTLVQIQFLWSGLLVPEWLNHGAGISFLQLTLCKGHWESFNME